LAFTAVLPRSQGSIPKLVSTLSTAAVLVIGGFKVMNGDMTVGMLVAYQTLLGSFMKPINTLVSFGSELQELQADMNRLDDVLRYPADKQYEQDRTKLEYDPRVAKLSALVELKNVTFGYTPLDPPLIQDFSLRVEPGRRVALVGSSGSGKSTVAKVISGLYPNWGGEILF